MAADANLMQGAYRAALGGTGARGFGGQRTSLGALGKGIEAAGKVGAIYIENRADQFDKAAKDAMANATGELSDEDWVLRYEQVQDLKKGYILGNKRERAEIMRELDKLSNEQELHDITKIEIVEGALGTDGVNNDWKGTDQGGDVQGIIDGNTPITYNSDTGAPGYIISNEGDVENFETAKDYFLSTNNLPLDAMEDWGLYDNANEEGQQFRSRVIDYYKHSMLTTGEKTQQELDDMFGEKWHSMEEVKGIIRDQRVDKVSVQNILLKARGDLLESSKLTTGPGNFPYEVMYDDTRDTIVGAKGVNLKSLGRDEIIPGSGRTWYKDMQEALITSNYEDLGIPLNEEQAEALDPTEGTPITPEDARVIVRNVMKDEDLYSHFLTTYITKFREQNWNKGATLRKNWNPAPYNVQQPSQNMNLKNTYQGGEI